MTEVAAESPGSVEGCLGSPNEPVAEPGYVCVYRGGFKGILEKEDKNAKFFAIYAAGGNINETASSGQLIAFRTTEFNEGVIEPIAKEAFLAAGGGWSVTAK